MSALSSKLRSVAAGTKTGIAYYCPACDWVHAVCTAGGTPRWEWDGNVDQPTLSPSVNVTYAGRGGTAHRCHHFLRAGEIQFLDDCTHALAGQTVPLPDWPDPK